jgi:hypothetical protein
MLKLKAENIRQTRRIKNFRIKFMESKKQTLEKPLSEPLNK